jgi:V-type H+-transporting ATPase subunit a
MSFAICLQVPNHLHFKRPLNIYAEFIPQILFLQSIFGYLVVCIILKWSTDWSKASTQPPGLLNMLIYMFLSPGSVKPEEQLFSGQGILQIVLLLTALVCVPWMLCVKPYMAWKELKGHEAQGYGRVGLGDDQNGELIAEEEGDGRLVAEQMEDQEEVSFLVIQCKCLG